MQVHLDESGNTEINLFDTQQPVFALSLNCISADDASALTNELLRATQEKAKFSKFRCTSEGRAAVIRLLQSDLLTSTTNKVTSADKRYYLISHWVGKLIEPLS